MKPDFGREGVLVKSILLAAAAMLAAGEASAREFELAPSASSMEEAQDFKLVDAPRPADRPFDQGSFALHVVGGYINGDAGFFGDTAESGKVDVGLGWYFKDDLGVYAEVSGYHWEQRNADADVEGIGLNVLLRWHFISRDDWSLFIDGGGGLVRFDDEFPAGGTHSNFIAKGGLGATYEVADNWHLIGGLRYFHLSNAARHGQDENPSIDGIEAYVGLMFTW